MGNGRVVGGVTNALWKKVLVGFKYRLLIFTEPQLYSVGQMTPSQYITNKYVSIQSERKTILAKDVTYMCLVSNTLSMFYKYEKLRPLTWFLLPFIIYI